MNVHAFYRVFQKYFRTRRMNVFSELFLLDTTTRIIDVGGYVYNWSLIKQEPNILFVNLEDEEWTKGRFAKTKGDGRCLPYEDNSFDIAYSNSVIEHVGAWEDQISFANEIRRVARRYYVQTPNKWFFIEPHVIAPFVHWLPDGVRKKLLPFVSVWYWLVKPSQNELDEVLNSIHLLDKRDVRKLFPEAEILEEKFLWMTKSFIAVRR